MKEAQLSAAGIVIDVIEGNNLNKVFQKYSQENKISPKDISRTIIIISLINHYCITN